MASDTAATSSCPGAQQCGSWQHSAPHCPHNPLKVTKAQRKHSDEGSWKDSRSKFNQWNKPQGKDSGKGKKYGRE